MAGWSSKPYAHRKYWRKPHSQSPMLNQECWSRSAEHRGGTDAWQRVQEPPASVHQRKLISTFDSLDKLLSSSERSQHGNLNSRPCVLTFLCTPGQLGTETKARGDWQSTNRCKGRLQLVKMNFRNSTWFTEEERKGPSTALPSAA